MQITYVDDVTPATQAKVRARYEADARPLVQLGFRDFCYYTELMRPYSALLNFPIMVMMRMKGEVLTRHPRLRIGASFLLLKHDTPSTVALPMGMGVKLYTAFSDGSLFVTTTFPSVAIPPRGQRVAKHGAAMSVEDGWKVHQQRVEGAVRAGKQVKPAQRFADFVEMSELEGNALAAGTKI